MVWVWVGWVVALAIALVVLGFCGFELRWKSRRLTSDLDALQGVATQLQAMADDLTVAARRAAQARAGSDGGA